MGASIELLADHRDLIEPVGTMRWKEWGHPPEPTDRSFWIDVTAEEAGRDGLPITWVAMDGAHTALGAVALGEFDIEERRDVSPWVMGMIVHPNHRQLGIGRMLLATLEGWATTHGYQQIWVGTGQAQPFYEKCGWQPMESFAREDEVLMNVLTRRL